MTKMDSESVGEIVTASAGVMSTSMYYEGVFGQIPISTEILDIQNILADYYSGYAFQLGSGVLDTTMSELSPTTTELDMMMNWEITINPMILYDSIDGWVSVTTNIVNRFYVDITVLSAPVEGGGDLSVTGPETASTIFGEDMSIEFTASSSIPATFTVYKQVYSEVDFVLDLSEANVYGSGEWDGSNLYVQTSSLLEGHYAITMVVEDETGATAQHTTFLIVTPTGDEYTSDGSTVVSRLNPNENLGDSVVSGYIPKAKTSIIDTLMDNKLLLVGIVVAVIVIGGIAFVFLTKKPATKAVRRKKRKTKSKKM
jgi:hypothetical protein